jgi:rhodanese-related sulfurtransferase
MLVQAGALGLLVAGGGSFGTAMGAAALLGVGTALVYPTLIAAVSDVAQPVERAQLVGVYRFWRDSGFVAGALIAGFVADAAGATATIALVAALTGGSGLWVALTRWRSRPAERPRRRKTADELLAEARRRIEPRPTPLAAKDAVDRGALLVDLRSTDERRRYGVIPGSLHVPRSVLEWRADPSSGFPSPHLGDFDRELVVFCAHGYSSGFAAVALQELGYALATDLDGGFEAWQRAGLPVQGACDPENSDALPGTGPPEPDRRAVVQRDS